MIHPITYPLRPLNGGNLDRGGIIPPVPSAWEPKGNGFRVTVHVPSRTCFNRHNGPLSIQGEFEDALAQLADSPFVWLDCEGLSRRHRLGKGSLVVIDVIDLHQSDYVHRHETLARCFPKVCCPDSIGVKQVCHFPAYVNDERYDGRPGFIVYGGNRWPREVWDRLKRQNTRLHPASPENWFWEGFVRKSLKSKYTLQLRSDQVETVAWTKHRFS